VKPAGGGIRRLAPLLALSLLLHLAVLLAISGSIRQKPADSLPQLPMTVDYVDSGANLGRPLQNPASRTAAPREAAPKSRPVMVPLQGSPVRDSSRVIAPISVLPVSTAKKGIMEMSLGKSQGGMETGTGSGGGSKVGSVTAAGHRDGGGPGGLQGNGPPGSTGGSRQRRAAYQETLKRLIEAHKEYPFAARRLRQEGSCQRRFILSRSGSVKQVEALTSCGYTYLNEAATRAITAVGTFPPLPDDFRGAEEAFTITIIFTLTSQ
jgi:protein TonB